MIAAAAAATVVGLSWILAVAARSTDVARTDDWGFAREALSLHRTGSFHFINWGPMTVVGQLLWAQPFLAVFGEHQWVLDVSVSVLVAFGIAAAYLLARTRLGVGRSLLVVGMLAAFPGVVRDASTFNTDPPSMSLQLICLALGAAALTGSGRRRAALFAAALLAGFWAFSIRELTLAAPLVVIVTMLSVERGTRRRWTLIGSGVFAVACAVLWQWHRLQPNIERYHGNRDLTRSGLLIVTMLITVSLVLAPAVVLSLPRWWRPAHRRSRLIGAAIGAFVLLLAPLLAADLGVANRWLMGDYLEPIGINGNKLALGVRPVVLPTVWWHVIIGVAMASTVVCGALLTEWTLLRVRTYRDRRDDPVTVDPVGRLLALHVAASVGLLVVAAVWNDVLFDRYIWPLVFTGSLSIMSRRPIADDDDAAATHSRLAGVLGGALLVSAAASALALTLNSNAFDAARWQAASDAVRSGLPANEVDGGFEWSGAHSTKDNLNQVPHGDDPLVAWWTAYVQMPQVCAVVTASPITSPNGTLVETLHWNRYLWWIDETVYVYRMSGTTCSR